MELRHFSLERYKGYARRAEVELAPLTILVGPNNAGKSALAQAIPLLAGGLTPSDADAQEPLPLESCGIRHGETFEDLVTGRAVHGRLRLSITLRDESGESSLSATITNVVAPGRTSERQISDWRLDSDGREMTAERQDFGASPDYRVSLTGESPHLRLVVWRGLLPSQPDALADWIGPRLNALETWAGGVRHLRCPRRLLPSPFRAAEREPGNIGPDGRDTPLALAGDDELRESVRDWYRKTFGVRVDLAAQGSYLDLVTGTPLRDDDVRIGQAGRGISHALLPAAPDELAPEQASRLADEPLVILVENRDSDGAFVARIVTELDRSLHGVWQREGNPIRFDSVGGVGQMREEVERQAGARPYRPRLVAVIDSDRKGPGDSESEAARRLRKTCDRHGLPCWVLAKREAENYLPRVLLRARPNAGAEHTRDEHARRVEAWEKLGAELIVSKGAREAVRLVEPTQGSALVVDLDPAVSRPFRHEKRPCARIPHCTWRHSVRDR